MSRNPAETAVSRQYIVTHHARKEMIEDDIWLYAIEDVILAGRIVERQRDRQTDEGC